MSVSGGAASSGQPIARGRSREFLGEPDAGYPGIRVRELQAAANPNAAVGAHLVNPDDFAPQPDVGPRDGPRAPQPRRRKRPRNPARRSGLAYQVTTPGECNSTAVLRQPSPNGSLSGASIRSSNASSESDTDASSLASGRSLRQLSRMSRHIHTHEICESNTLGSHPSFGTTSTEASTPTSAALQREHGRHRSNIKTASRRGGPGSAPIPQVIGAPVFSHVFPTEAGREARLDVDDVTRPGLSGGTSSMVDNYGWVVQLKWGMTAVAAAAIALQAGLVRLIVNYTIHLKMQAVGVLCRLLPGGHFVAFTFLLLCGVPLCIAAALLVLRVAPHASGSGLPEVRVSLNSIPLPQAFTFRTWASRLVGLILVGASGLVAGMEEPMAHLGAIIDSGLTNELTWRGESLWPSIPETKYSRCYSVAQGASMGIAAAFGAPIGATVFSLEEASTFWSRDLTCQMLFSTVITGLVTQLIQLGLQALDIGGVIEFPDEAASYEAWELCILLPFAIAMGLSSAGFCLMVRYLLVRRRTFFRHAASQRAALRDTRLFEVVLILLFSVTICFYVPVMVGCRDLGPDHSRAAGAADLTGGMCGEHAYSEIAYLLLQPKEAAIKLLFSGETSYELSIPGLLGCYAIVSVLSWLTFGARIPVGLFGPSLLSGACAGRALGQWLNEWGCATHPSVYALMGAAASLAGLSRMTGSLVVILLEVTRSMSLALPLTMVIMMSKFIADQFERSVCHVVLDENPDIKLLENHLSEDTLLVLDGITVHDVCTRNIVVLHQYEYRHQVLKLLLESQFGGYPVVDQQKRLVGLATRNQLVKALTREDSAPEGDHPGDAIISVFREADMTPETTSWKVPIARAFHHFRAMDLQHLCVVDEYHTLLGILTRTDFARFCRPGPDAVFEVQKLMNDQKVAIAEASRSTSRSSTIRSLIASSVCASLGAQSSSAPHSAVDSGADSPPMSPRASFQERGEPKAPGFQLGPCWAASAGAPHDT